jgi:hypothetical protein
VNLARASRSRGRHRVTDHLLLLATLCLLLFGAIASGWIVGRLHRAHGIAMVVCFAAFIALVSGAVTIRTALLIYAWTPSTVIRVALSAALSTVAPAAIVAGGFWATRPPE